MGVATRRMSNAGYRNQTRSFAICDVRLGCRASASANALESFQQLPRASDGSRARRSRTMRPSEIQVSLPELQPCQPQVLLIECLANARKSVPKLRQLGLSGRCRCQRDQGDAHDMRVTRGIHPNHVRLSVQ